MFTIKKSASVALFILCALLATVGCQNNQRQEGIHVMFQGTPGIYHSEVFFHGQVIGTVQETLIGNSGVSKITIRINPEFKQHSGKHWAFYIENGRLTAGRINSSGRPVEAGDLLCGFHSKMAFQWFKFKTLLSDRISKANRRAEKLYQQFDQAA